MIRNCFNDDWKVSKGAGMLAMLMGMTPEEKEVVLPHDAMIHETPVKDAESAGQTGFYPGGLYNYTREFDAPADWQGKDVFLEFEGVYQTAAVFVNGEFAGRNLYGYSEFTVEISRFLKFGEKNLVKVEANNAAVPNSRWYSGSGIYRNVNLLVGNTVHISQNGLRITTKEADPEFAVVEIETGLQNISRDKHTVFLKTELLYEGICVKEDIIRVTMLSLSEETVRQNLLIHGPKLWSTEDPQLYTVRTTLTEGGEVLDEAEEVTGLRVLSLDAERGLRINGKEIKMAGTCIHHDNGILGAATFAAAEEKRAREMKAAGFNAVRSAHHPMSREMLHACDKYGLVVMDELSDMWNIRKNNNDFSNVFDTFWETEVRRMVTKDYNHPCVVMYSAGNEIPDLGTDSGVVLARKISTLFHELDSTRYTTQGANGLIAGGGRGVTPLIAKDLMEKMAAQAEVPAADSGDGQEGGVGQMNMMMSLLNSDDFCTHPLLTEAMEEAGQATDICGYNYLTGRHMLEKELHPNKPLVGSETYPDDIPRLWGLVKRNHHILGDFTWTGYDYLGEAGCGIIYYDGTVNFSSRFPDRASYIGDINLIGYRRPISYWREIVFGARKEPYIAVLRMDKDASKASKTAWIFKDNVSSWTWPGFEGQTASVDVYSADQEVELYLNGKSLGRKAAGEDNRFMATFEVPYEKGELRAVSYQDGQATGEFVLKTAEEKVYLSAEYDREIIKAGGQDIGFVTVTLRDKDGTDNLFAKKAVSVFVEGAGVLQAFGSADPTPAAESSYDNTEWDTYDGQVMAAIRSGKEAGEIRVIFRAEGCEDAVVTLKTEA